MYSKNIVQDSLGMKWCTIRLKSHGQVSKTNYACATTTAIHTRKKGVMRLLVSHHQKRGFCNFDVIRYRVVNFDNPSHRNQMLLIVRVLKSSKY